jgi:hypothetical protein
LRPRQWSQVDLVDLLGQLPEGYLVTPVHSSWFVVGPPGVYVLALERPDDHDDAGLTVGPLASQVRTALAQHLAWVPFVHAHLVSNHLRAIPQATVVPADMLLGVLTEGRPSVDDEIMRRITEMVGRGIIARVSLPVEDRTPAARMGLCEPSPLPPEPISSSTSSEATATPRSSPTRPASMDGSGLRSPLD